MLAFKLAHRKITLESKAGLLKLNCDKALHHLRWTAVLGFEETARLTAEWYRAYYDDPEAISTVTDAQLRHYSAVAGLGVA